jgi:hypothetical protein
MSALTMPARPDSGDAALRPLPWRRMAGVTWRQHRLALAGVVVLLGALAVWLWSEGISVHHAWDAAIACQSASSPACQDAAASFNGTWDLMSIPAILLQVVPGLIGAFVGAPVLARELETGTFRFAWTQGFDRWRWALAKLAALAVVLAAAGVAFGALAGILIRRVVPAIVATLAVYAGLAIATAGLLREHYLTPLVTGSPTVPGSAWLLGQSWTKDGRFAFAGNPPLNLINQFCNFPQPGSSGKGGGPSSANPFAQCLSPHGYTMWTSYQPASWFWPFQWIEGGWLLALSVPLIAATIWLVHRRAA